MTARNLSKHWVGAAWLLVMLAASLGVQRAAIAQTSATIEPGDVLKISVYGNPDLTTVTRVLPNGTVTFPLIGQVRVGGQAPVDAERRIAERLSNGGFVRNAAVSIFVQERSAKPVNSVTLLGHVGRSGTFSLDQESPEAVTSLITLLAQAGGVTERAADHCYLIRKENGQARKTTVDLENLLRLGDVKSDLMLMNGDVVLVPETDVFYIYGEVKQPGRYRLERDMTVMHAVSVASGITDRGNLRGIQLHRPQSGQMVPKNSFLEEKLMPNDVVFVKTAVF
jgi:polysaccharide export outer membrane protein